MFPNLWVVSSKIFLIWEWLLGQLPATFSSSIRWRPPLEVTLQVLLSLLCRTVLGRIDGAPLVLVQQVLHFPMGYWGSVRCQNPVVVVWVHTQMVLRNRMANPVPLELV